MVYGQCGGEVLGLQVFEFLRRLYVHHGIAYDSAGTCDSCQFVFHSPVVISFHVRTSSYENDFSSNTKQFRRKLYCRSRNKQVRCMHRLHLLYFFKRLKCSRCPGSKRSNIILVFRKTLRFYTSNMLPIYTLIWASAHFSLKLDGGLMSKGK